MNSSNPGTSSAGGGGSGDSKFTQQELPACKPILTPQWVISAFVLISVIFIPIGVASLLASRNVVEIVDRYETECIPVDQRNDKLSYIYNKMSAKPVPKLMKQPYMSIINSITFTRNHRRPIVPCGLIAWSMFNDTYSFSWADNKTLALVTKSFQNFQKGVIQGGAPTGGSHCVMRTAALPTFRKLYGRIEEDLGAGDVIVVTLENNYNTYKFDGKKKLNDFLGIAYLAVGGICIIIAMVFTIIYLVRPRQLGDPSYLSWNRNPSGH
ncbi:hypothetical protein MKW92_052055 [Papaver armeniacum]|nr:hypothetical protein MKW92_052055 [Papaver armeniacum]